MLFLICAETGVTIEFGFGAASIVKKKVKDISAKVVEKKKTVVTPPDGPVIPPAVAVDSVAPVISNISANVGFSSAAITWITDEQATSQAEFGLTPGLGTLTTENQTKTINHCVSLYGLSPETTYYYKVKCKDASQNQAISSTYTFVTAPASDVIVTFTVSVPAVTPSTDTVYVVFVPFYGGHGELFRNPMNKISSGNGSMTFSGSALLNKNSFMHYFYDRSGSGTENIESRREIFTSTDNVIAYRYLLVSTNTVNDVVARWRDIDSAPKTGTIKGSVTSGAVGLMDATVSIAGVHCASHNDGTYELDNVPAGGQRITVMTSLGDYKATSKIVTVTDGGTTTADFDLQPAKKVNVTFLVKPPADIPANASIRMVGDTQQMSGAFWDKNELNYWYTDRYIFMAKSGNNFTATVQLYEGSDIEYMYTLGGNVYGDERDYNIGNFVFRHIQVGSDNMTINDTINSFKPLGQVPVTLNVTIPADTPASDRIYFNSVTMNKVSATNWTFTYYTNPGWNWKTDYVYLHGINKESGREKFTPDDISTTRTITPVAATTLNETVTDWRWLPGYASYPQAYAFSTAPASIEISTRSAFYSGIYFYDFWQPDFLTALQNSLDQFTANSLDYQYVVLSTIRGYGKIDPPVIENRSLNYNVGSVDTPLEDLKNAVDIVHSKGRKAVLYPQVNMEMTPGYGGPANDSDQWYNADLKQIEDYWLYCARVCQEKNIDALALWGWAGHHYDDPAEKDVVNQWMKTTLAKVRAIYTGKIICYEYGFGSDYDWYGAPEINYLGINPWGNLTVSTAATVQEIRAALETNFDTNIKPYCAQYNKKLVVTQLGRSSVHGAVNTGGSISSFGNDNSSYVLDLDEQARFYEAFCLAISSRPWVVGVFPFGYDYIDTPYDKDFSIRGKPAETVLKNYYPLFNASIR